MESKRTSREPIAKPKKGEGKTNGKRKYNKQIKIKIKKSDEGKSVKKFG
jgi:hypothetical protein